MKDLGDEYSDNYPRLGIMLSKFYGLGTQYTVEAIDDFIKHLLLDDEIKDACQTWIYGYSSPDALIRLFYNLGFAGIAKGEVVTFKSSESPLAMVPIITDDSTVVIHPTYADALSLKKTLVDRIGDDVVLRRSGIVAELPESTCSALQRQNQCASN